MEQLQAKYKSLLIYYIKYRICLCYDGSPLQFLSNFFQRKTFQASEPSTFVYIYIMSRDMTSHGYINNIKFLIHDTLYYYCTVVLVKFSSVVVSFSSVVASLGAIVVGSAGLNTQLNSSVDPVDVIVHDRSPEQLKFANLLHTYGFNTVERYIS